MVKLILHTWTYSKKKKRVMSWNFSGANNPAGSIDDCQYSPEWFPASKFSPRQHRVKTMLYTHLLLLVSCLFSFFSLTGSFLRLLVTFILILSIWLPPSLTSLCPVCLILLNRLNVHSLDGCQIWIGICCRHGESTRYRAFLSHTSSLSVHCIVELFPLKIQKRYYKCINFYIIYIFNLYGLPSTK